MRGSRGGRGQFWPHLLAAWFAVAAMLAAARPVSAEPEPVLSVSVGHAGAVRLHYFFPIRVEIAWVAKPGEPITGEAQRARVEVRVPQDMVYGELITRDITVQPGRDAVVVLYARTVQDFSEIEVALRDDRGRVLARTRPASTGAGGWLLVPDHHAIIMVVGQSTMPRSGWVFDHGNLSPVKVEELEAADLPREWPGYDGVTLVVLEDLKQQRLDATQLATLLDWVRSGGRLAITITNQLDTFRQVLGDLDVPAIVESYEAEPFDRSVGDVLSRAAARAVNPDARGAALSIGSESPFVWYNSYLPTLKKELAAYNGRTFYSREIRLDESAEDRGWTVRDARLAYDPESSIASHRTHGHIAWGPLGLGEVTLLGLDPASLAGGDANELRGVGWWQCLLHVGPLRDTVSADQAEMAGYYSPYGSSTASAMSTEAINGMLDTLSATFGVSRGLFGAIAVALLLLVLLIGPVDFFLLRWIRREPLTWITCPLLVLLACGAIYLAQEAVSYGRARVIRATLIDVSSGAGRGAATSFTSIYSNQGGRYSLRGLGDGVYQTPVSWNYPWAYYYSGGDGAAALVPIVQDSRGSLVESINVPLENVRWLMDRGPVDVPEITALVRYDRARDRLSVDLTAPADWQGRIAAVQWNEGWYVPSGSATLVEGRITAAAMRRDPGDAEAAKLRKKGGSANALGYFSNNALSGWVHDGSYQLPGHREIGERITGLGPSAAAVLIEFEHRSELELTRNGAHVAAEWTEAVHVRLLAPAQRIAETHEEPQP